MKKKTSLPCVWEKTRGGKRRQERKYKKQQLRLLFIMCNKEVWFGRNVRESECRKRVKVFSNKDKKALLKKRD